MIERLRSPVLTFGGKGKMVAKLLPFIAPHRRYVEPFGGGGSLLLAKKPGADTYNDIDGRLVNLFRVIRDPVRFEEFKRLVSLTPYAREEYEQARDRKEHWEGVEDAHKFFVAARMGFSGKSDHGWGRVVEQLSRGVMYSVSRYLSTIDMLPQIHARLMTVQIEQSGWRKALDRFDGPDAYFYLDPPYLPATRKSGGYKHELTEEDHRELLAKCLGLEAMTMLSGYPNEIYREALEGGAGWQRVDFQTACHAAGRTKGSGLQGKGAALKMQPRTESIWLNPQLRKALGYLPFGKDGKR